MTKVKFSALVSEMRGKLNGSVFTKNRYGNSLRNKVTPVNRRTASQQSIKAMFTQFSQKWRSLTDAQQKAWNSAVEDFRRNNIFGDSIKPTGSNLYCELNSNLALVGANELTEPPIQMPINGIQEFSLIIDGSSSTQKFDIAFGPSPTDADVAHLIFATRCYSPGKSYIKGEYRLIGTIPANTNSSYSALSEWNTKFGALAKDQMISVKLIPVHRKTGCKFRAGNELASKVL
jgi:hypothetical protein